MTALAVIARAVTAAMSLAVLWNVARIGEELVGTRRAGVWAAAGCACSSIFTYYSQTTNLEVPYLFWSTLALRALIRGISPARRPRPPARARSRGPRGGDGPGIRDVPPGPPALGAHVAV